MGASCRWATIAAMAEAILATLDDPGDRGPRIARGRSSASTAPSTATWPCSLARGSRASPPPAGPAIAAAPGRVVGEPGKRAPLALAFLVRDLGGGGVSAASSGSPAPSPPAATRSTSSPARRPGRATGRCPRRSGSSSCPACQAPRPRCCRSWPTRPPCPLLAPAMLTKARPSPTIATCPASCATCGASGRWGSSPRPTDLNLEAVWAAPPRRRATAPVAERVHLSTALEELQPAGGSATCPPSIGDATRWPTRSSPSRPASPTTSPERRAAARGDHGRSTTRSSARSRRARRGAARPSLVRSRGSRRWSSASAGSAAQKDFPTLIRAFAACAPGAPARLVILGGAKDRRQERQRRAAAARSPTRSAWPRTSTCRASSPTRSPTWRGPRVFVLSSRLGGLRQRAGRGPGLRLPGGQHRLPERPGGDPGRRPLGPAGAGRRRRGAGRGIEQRAGGPAPATRSSADRPPSRAQEFSARRTVLRRRRCPGHSRGLASGARPEPRLRTRAVRLGLCDARDRVGRQVKRGTRQPDRQRETMTGPIRRQAGCGRVSRA